MTQNQAERWKKLRSHGKWAFVGGSVFVWVVLQVVIAIGLDLAFGDPVSITLIRIILAVIGGLVLGLVFWWDREARYQSFSLDEKINDGLKRARS